MVTNTQEVYEIRSIFPVRINPSIVEGGKHYSSILGPNRSESLVRFAPTFVFPPTITGDLAIPSILTCSEGTVSAAPAAQRSYQWYVDGLPYPGATTPTFETYEDLDGKPVKCVVTASNPLGSVFAETNVLIPSLILPIYINEADYCIVTGMGMLNNTTAMDVALYVVTGVEMENHMTVFGNEIYGAMIPNFVGQLPLINPGAEDGTTGWTTESGSFDSVVTTARTGTRVFTSLATTAPTAGIGSQTVALDPSLHSAVDAGNLMATLECHITNNTTGAGNVTAMTIRLSAVDGTTGVVTDLEVMSNLNPPMIGVSGWIRPPSISYVVPANTRSLKVTLQFFTDFNGKIVRCQVDDVAVNLFTIN